MSKLIIFLWLVFLLFLLMSQIKKQIYKNYLIIIVCAFLIGIIIFSPVSQRFVEMVLFDESIASRVELALASIPMILSSPIFGVGGRHFIVHIPQFSFSKELFLQPVHNVYLLIAAEYGIVGLFFFGLFIVAVIRQIFKKGFTDIAMQKTFIAVTILIIGFFDHYLITVQQGLLLSAFLFSWLLKR